jgi:dihydrofolate reductase
MDGGELASALIEGGAVDEIGLNVHPVLLGGGIPFLRPMAKGCVFLRYRVDA